MKLLERLRLLVRSALHDVLSEEPANAQTGAAAYGQPAGDEALAAMNGLLGEAQRDLDSLRLELAQAVEHERRIAQSQQQAGAQERRLDAAIDAALQHGDEETARRQQQQLNRMQVQQAEMERMHQQAADLTDQIRQAVTARQERLSELQSRLQSLAERQRAAQTLESLQRTQRELAHQTETLRAALHASEEQLTRRADLAAARQEWER